MGDVTPESLRQRARWLRADNIGNPYSAVFDRAADTIERLRERCSWQTGQIKEAVAILERGTEYERLHVPAILAAALALPTTAPEAIDG